jgi:hypothetical protein
MGDNTIPHLAELATMLANTNPNIYDGNWLAAQIRQRQLNIANEIVNVIFWAYRVVNPVAGLLALAGIGTLIAGSFRNSRRLRNSPRLHRLSQPDKADSRLSPGLWLLLPIVALVGLAFVYSFAIGWFASFHWVGWGNQIGGIGLPVRAATMVYNAPGVVSLLSPAIVLGATAFFGSTRVGRYHVRVYENH